ncbi:efflux RND transporter periplasmic adaptor subunit [Marixanthomonas spongiae]|uniref:Efflux RND transporter periplasmic adaptor subunit n=1 Tax=Marixanthomonas spongiae TaxID=2174845 RepID=A0A2U0HXD7_9FLAO|nr:efflux RND transporter periplasmic adaptor subunit [Marixanthomonas spongiae]PVW13489.1 efflux RND transporter periplasmic adaptor subunit [Marixanthomonas spongiae]
MKKNIIYILLALVGGLLVGYLIFGTATEGSVSEKDISELSDSHDHEGETVAQMWTCSMHPQIMQPEPGDCPICGMDLIPAESTSDGLAANEFTMTENAMALANIQTTVVGSANISENGTMSLSGKILENEEANAIQTSYFDGRIERLNMNYKGQEVNKGQLLATIYAPKLVAAQQELITAASLKESQPALYKAVRNKLKLWKLSEKQINAIETSGVVRENFPIYATVSGTVSEVLSAEGDYVKQGQPILKMTNLNTVWATFDVYENQISEISKGQEVIVTTNAYPNKEFTATISFINPVLDTQTRTVKVRATLKNTEGVFKPGMFVTGTIEGLSDTSGSSQITVPASAVLWTGERSLVYVKTAAEKPVFEMREVTLGTKSGDNYTITDGLVPGDEIVTNGTFTVDAAAQLQGKKSMMNPSENEDEIEDEVEMEMELSESVQQQLKGGLPNYFAMKNAFVESDSKKVSQLASEMSSKLATIKETNLGAMEQKHIAKSKEILKMISESDDLEDQRNHFVGLNQTIIPLFKNMENNSETIFIQKCPMANSNKGASWLSTEEEIRNPYYGDAMMTCGSVIDSIE